MTFIMRYFKVFFVILVGLIVILIAYLLLGFGHLSFSTQNYAAVFLNDIYIGTPSSPLKVRPGTYTVEISAPQTTSKKSVVVLPFSNIIVTNDSLVQRNIDTDVINAAQYNPKQVSVRKGKLINDVWYAGLFDSPSSTNVFAAKFENGQWGIVFTGYPEDDGFTSLIPSDVQAYIKEVSNGQLTKNGN